MSPSARICGRLDELRPLVREFERLQEAEAALADGSPPSGKRAGQPKRGGTRPRRGGGSRGGHQAERWRRAESAADAHRGEVREEALPGGATGYRIADDRTAPSASGRDGEPSE